MNARNWKRVLVIVFAICALACHGLCEPIESGTIYPPNLNETGLSAQQWYKTKESRTLLVAGAWLDCLDEVPDSFADILLESMGTNTIYVANVAENEVDVYFFGKNRRLDFMYTPRYDVAFYQVYEQKDASLQSEAYMKEHLANGKCSSYDNVTEEDIETYLNL